jgi:SAM-dependent methyltransferase
MNIKYFIEKKLRPNARVDFLAKLSSSSLILDVGCGNNSSFRTKNILPGCNYTGIDIGDYNQTKPMLADSYIITTPENFHIEISKFSNQFDVVISSHNLEHCNFREKTLDAMLNALKINGKLYLSFPCEESINFPNRKGTLNYYDDPTHKFSPPCFKDILSQIEANGFMIEYSTKKYSPGILYCIGFLLEPFSKLMNKLMKGTWEFYGFESIVVARKIK